MNHEFLKNQTFIHSEICQPGPPTVLMEDEEDCLAKYLIKMSEMGLDMNKEIIMEMVCRTVDTTGIKKMKKLDVHGLKDSRGITQI